MLKGFYILENREAYMNLKDVYWIRFGLALAVALLSGFLKIWGIGGLLLAIVVYILTQYTFRRKLGEEVESKKLLLEGIGTYFLVWLTTWTVLYNFLK
ncbi:hypothetical protein KEJ27_09505 [Candidatus Bathyarchaeota archaeon]|nr:hypothetical protein [Candidatus Bathyarchaeota archaeon]MBS7613968.1 hypothetical protein [Candidatus Bathyarchaeota archaeon]MBS7613969.1 hypothetical protein [Candidatus Bathyarchaeota archaeon]MBS7618055.1 hypothetical protein [Candidatus Bathyarchaeota archaeon]